LENPTLRVLTSNSKLASNTLLNFVGQAMPLLVGVVAMPFIVRGLGTQRFALLSLAWVMLGLFTIFDLGLARATTKYVAEALGQGEEDRVPQILWTTVTIQVGFGIVGALLLVSMTPLLVQRILNIPSELVAEAKITFYLLAPAIPIVMVLRSFSGLLEAAQRFDLVNAVNVPASVALFLLPLVAVAIDLGLPAIIVILVISRLSALLVQLWLSTRIFQGLNVISRPDVAELRILFRFGGWVTLTNVLIPTLFYLDRFMIGGLLPIKALAYYSAPRDMVSRLRIIPGSLSRVLFPAFSSLASRGAQDELNEKVARSTKYVITAMMVPTLVLFMFAKHLLALWLGNDFAVESTGVLRLVSVVALLAAIGHIPVALVEGIGRPDIVTKIHFIVLPLHAGLAYFLIGQLGITGAAWAWFLNAVWYIPVFFVVSMKTAGISLKALSENGTDRSLAVAASLLIIAVVIVGLGTDQQFAIIGLIAFALVTVYTTLVWFYTFDQFDRDFIKKILKWHHLLSGKGR
jgi:O-antigen/teichoic acid export membrane protein